MSFILMIFFVTHNGDLRLLRSGKFDNLKQCNASLIESSRISFRLKSFCVAQYNKELK